MSAYGSHILDPSPLAHLQRNAILTDWTALTLSGSFILMWDLADGHLVTTKKHKDE